MEIIDNTVNNENTIDTTIELDQDKIKLLRRRGFYLETNKVDDKFSDYNVLTSHSFFRSDIKLIELFGMPFEKMKEQLFSKDSVISQEVCSTYEKGWYSSFNGSQLFYDVRPDCLEPYISRYVRAINRCGMKTFYSCDGWHRKPHKSKEMVVLFDDRYSWIWHKIICEQFGGIKWEYGKKLVRFMLPYKDDDKLIIYEKINNDAVYFENNCDSLRKLKVQVIDGIGHTCIDRYSDEEVEEKMRDVFNCNIGLKEGKVVSGGKNGDIHRS